MSLLAVERVGKSFGGIRALHDVSFDVADGEIVGLMGANGAGKTTLFSVIAGHDRPGGGSVHFDGVRIDGLTPDRVCRAGIARTFQIVRPFGGLSVRENVATAALFGSRPAAGPIEADRRANVILEEVGLGPQANELAAALTLSAQKKLEVAKALATSPRLLMLDEVMAGLTPTEVHAMMGMIRTVKERYDLTILIIEHVMRALMDLSRHIIVLHHGEKIAEGAPADIATDPNVQAAYLGTGR